MQKKFLAVAVALSSLPAFGQLSLYGTVDVGLQQLDLDKRADGKEVKVFRMASGMLSTPRLGLKGEQAIGMYGLQAGFQLEGAFVMKSGSVFAQTPTGRSNVNIALDPTMLGTTPLFTRQARVYVSGSMGELSLGLQPTPLSFVVSESDVTHGGLSMTSSNLFDVVKFTSFAENSLSYHSPEYNGLSACFLLATGDEVPSMNATQDAYLNKDSGRMLSAALEYNSGPLYAGFGYSTEDYISVPGVQITTPGYNAVYLASLSYDFGMAKPYFSYYMAKQYSAATGGAAPVAAALQVDAAVFSLGVSVPAGDFGYVLANFGCLKEEVSNGGAHIYGVGYAYSFNRNATVYADYAYLSNTKDSTGTVGQSLTLNGAMRNGFAVPQAVSKPQSFEIGLRYRF